MVAFTCWGARRGLEGRVVQVREGHGWMIEAYFLRRNQDDG